MKFPVDERHVFRHNEREIRAYYLGMYVFDRAQQNIDKSFLFRGKVFGVGNVDDAVPEFDETVF